MSAIAKENDRLKSSLTHMRKRVAEEGESLMETGVGFVAAVAMGAADEKYGDDAVFGTSVPAVAAGAGLLADLSGWAGSMSPMARAVGRAGLHIEGFRFGQRKMREWDEDEPAGD